MITHTDYAQGSTDWAIARAGIPTASEFDNILTPDLKPRTGEMPKSYMAKKLAEWWIGGPLAGFNVFDADQGRVLEDEAKPFFELQFGQEVSSVAFITTDDGRIGCSPDGLVGPLRSECGLEIKCPLPETHIKYLLNGGLPKDYAPQVHGSMLVTGFSRWQFMSYRRHFPPLLVTVERDDKIQESIKTAMDAFLKEFETAKARLIELNGGPPQRAAVLKQYTPPVESEIIP